MSTCSDFDYLTRVSQGQLARRGSPFLLLDPAASMGWCECRCSFHLHLCQGDRACSTAGPSGLWQDLGLVQEVGHQTTRNLTGVRGIATDQIILVCLWQRKSQSFWCVLQGIPGFDGPPGGLGPRGGKVLLYFHLLEIINQMSFCLLSSSVTM